MANTKRYVVEARLPIEINSALSPKEAASIAIRYIESTHGIKLTGWELRIFEFSGEPDDLDCIEYFGNPSGTVFRDKNQNIEVHQNMIELDQTPEDKN